MKDKDSKLIFEAYDKVVNEAGKASGMEQMQAYRDREAARAHAQVNPLIPSDSPFAQTKGGQDDYDIEQKNKPSAYKPRPMSFISGATFEQLHDIFKNSSNNPEYIVKQPWGDSNVAGNVFGALSKSKSTGKPYLLLHAWDAPHNTRMIQTARDILAKAGLQGVKVSEPWTPKQ